MTRVRVEAFSISIDGFGAGVDQTLANPLGVGGEELHNWIVGTRTFKNMGSATDEGTTGMDDDYTARAMQGVGSWILGRNMFTSSRGAWPNDEWKGWWGKNPPYHVPVYVLTHHARAPIEMEGNTTFHFVTGGIHEAMERARDSANGKDIRIGGGVSTIQQYLRAGLIDDVHLAISPVVLGRGERLFEGVDMPALGYEVLRQEASDLATHVTIGRKTR